MSLEGLELTQEEQTQITGTVEPTPTPEPTPAPSAPEPAPTQTAPEVTPPAPETPKVVPLAALHEAREEARELKRQLKIVEDLKQEILAIREANKPKPAPLPSFEEDPLNNMKGNLQRIDTIEKKQEDLESRQTQINQQIQIAQTVKAVEDQFRQTTPDYDKAYGYMVNFRIEELKELGVTDPKEVNLVLANNAQNLAMNAMQQGKNPAELIYTLAKRYGYKPAEAPTPAPILEQAQQKTLDQQNADLQAIEKGQQTASRTLSGAGKSDTDITMNTLLNADGEDFDKLWKQMFAKAK